MGGVDCISLNIRAYLLVFCPIMEEFSRQEEADGTHSEDQKKLVYSALVLAQQNHLQRLSTWLGLIAFYTC